MSVSFVIDRRLFVNCYHQLHDICSGCQPAPVGVGNELAEKSRWL